MIDIYEAFSEMKFGNKTISKDGMTDLLHNLLTQADVKEQKNALNAHAHADLDWDFGHEGE